jgi:hypothetical protein
MESRADALGVRFELQEASITGCRVDELVNAVKGGGTAIQRSAVASAHAAEARDAYIDRDREDAVMHALFAASMTDGLSASDANNVAYILIASGYYHEARKLLGSYKGGFAFQNLMAYNYGIASLKTKDYEEASHGFMQASLAAEGGDATEAMVLLVPSVVNGELVLNECWSTDSDGDSQAERLDVPEAARAALELVKHMLPGA